MTISLITSILVSKNQGDFENPSPVLKVKLSRVNSLILLALRDSYLRLK